jgi:hypothetical protein
LYNIFIEFGVLRKFVNLIKMCLNETYSRVWVDKNLFDMFPVRNFLKQGNDLSPLLFNFAVENAISRVQVNHDGLKLNGTHHLLVYADDVNKLCGSVHTIKKNTEAVVVSSKEIRLEENVYKTMHTVVSRDQNAGQSQNKILIIVPSKGWNSSNMWEQT